MKMHVVTYLLSGIYYKDLYSLNLFFSVSDKEIIFLNFNPPTK